MKDFVAAISLIAFSFLVTDAAADSADSVYINGKIFTASDTQPWAEAMATRGDKLVFVGSNEAARAFIGPLTRVTDLKTRMVMPGIHDAHTCWRSLKTDHLCSFKIDQGWKPGASAPGALGL